MKRILGWSVLVFTAVGCSFATNTGDAGTDAGLPLVPVARIEVNARRYGDLPGLANADFVAMRDGQGTWQVVEGVGGEYGLPVTDARGSFSAFVVCPGQPSIRETVLIQATLGETPLTSVPCLQSVDLDGGLIVDANATLDVAKLNFDEQEVFQVEGNVGGAASFTDFDGLFWKNGIDQVPTGFYDVIAFGTTQPGALVNGWIAHHQRVEGTTELSFDLITAPSVQTAQVTVTPAVANIQELIHASFLSTQYSDPLVLTAGTLGRVSLFPDVLMDEGDFNGILTTYFDSQTSSHGHLRLAKSTGDFTLPLPAAITGTLTVAASTPAVRLNYAWSGGPSSAGFALLANQPNVMSLVWVSPASLAGTSSWAAPDLTQIPGWESEWGLVTGVPTTWTALNLGGGAAGWRQGVRLLPFNVGAFTEEVDADSAQTTGTFTP